MIVAFASHVADLRGWRRAGLAFTAGALGALAIAPFNLFPVLAICFPVAVWLLDGAGRGNGTRAEQAGIIKALWRAALTGWLFGFGYFLASLWWIGNAFLVEAEDFAWLLPFAVILLPAGLAFFTSFGFALAKLLWTTGPARILAFAASLSVSEWLRGHLFTGFPWNLYGYALVEDLRLAQSLSVLGAYGLTLVVLLLFASPAALERKGGWRWPAMAVTVLLAMAAAGQIRLSANPTAYVDNVRLRIMQPAIPQDDKFNYDMRNPLLTRYLALSRSPHADGSDGMTGVTHLIWPESPFPFLLSDDKEALGVLGQLLEPGAVLLTGAGRAENTNSTENPTRYFNSMHMVDSTGTIIGNYDKVHLVPFGEYLPFQTVLESIGLRQLTLLRGGFSSGPKLQTIDVPGAPPMGVLICYEVIFPGEAVDSTRRPGWLLNLTNDAWFGITPGPYQHFLQTRARAIEEGLPLVRSANNGISAVIDPVGRVVARLDLGSAGILDSELPSALPAPFFSRNGGYVFVILLLATLASYAGLQRRQY